MNGGWHVYPRGARWRRPRSLGLGGAGGRAARRRSSSAARPCGCCRADAASRRDPQLARLGPDILAPDFDLDAVVGGAPRRDPGRALGDALLDQTLVAGIGNIFKSEACFAARVDPWRPVGELADEELARRPRRRPRRRCCDAVERGGATASPSTARRGPCPRCGGRVRLARPGRRQPHHLLVPALPGVVTGPCSHVRQA